MDALFSEELDLLLAVSLRVVLGAFADVLLTVLQRAIDQSGEPVDTVRVKTETVYSGAKPVSLWHQPDRRCAYSLRFQGATLPS